MFRETIPARQLSAWLFAAMTPVLIQFLGGTPWLWVEIAGVVSIGAVWSVWRWGIGVQRRWLSLLQVVIIIIVLSQLAGESAQSWPVGNSYPAIPLFLLALAAWSAQKGPSAAARVGTVLFWAVLLIYLLVFGAGVKEIELEWLMPRWSEPNWMGLLLLLTPAVAVHLLRHDEKWGVRLMLPKIFALCAAAITAGVLSPIVAERTNNAFYEMSRSLNLLGVAKRFEAFISAGMTVGWFALMSLYLSICGKLSERLHAGWGRTGVWTASIVAAVLMLCDLHIKDWILLILVTIFWVLIPVLTQGIEQEKKS